MKRYLLALLIVLLPSAFAATIPDFQVSLLNYEPSPTQPGQTIDVFVEVSSTENPTKDAWLEIVEEYPFTVLPSQDYTRAKNLGVVSSPQKLQFQIRIAENAKDGLTPLTIRYGVDRSGVFEEAIFDINIQTFDAKIGIIDVRQIPERLVPGEEGAIELVLRNYDDQPLKNIDVLVDFTDSYDMSSNMNNIIAVQAMINARLEEVNRRIASGLSPLTGVTPMMQREKEERKATEFKVLAPVGVSTQNRIPDLSGGDSYTLRIPVRALPDVLPDVYAVPLYVSYNDEDNTPFHIRAELPVVIDMAPELYVELSSTTLRTTDFGGDVVFTVANRGLSDLRYVTLTLEEDESVELLTAPRSVYIGDLAPGEAKEGVFTVIAHEKEIVLPLGVSYRDGFNTAYEYTERIPHYIINKNYYRDLPYEMWLVWLILGGVILALTVFYVNHMKKK